MGSRARMVRISLALFAVLAMSFGDVSAGSEGEVNSRAVRSSAPATPRAAAIPAPAPAAPKPSPPAKRPVRKTARRPVRTVGIQRWTPFARIGRLPILHPAQRVERVGFHQAGDVRNRAFTVLTTAVRPTVLPSRYRGTSRLSAVDIVVHPQINIRAPVSGIVKRAGGYRLYCEHPDGFVTISPDRHPELEVKILHVRGLHVQPGDRVVAGRTVIANNATKFPFGSQIDAYTADPAWPHVHMEVTTLEVPDATPTLDKLTFGNCG